MVRSTAAARAAGAPRPPPPRAARAADSAPASFLQVGVAPAAADELREEVRETGHVLQPHRRRSRLPSKSPPMPDVVRARHLAHVLDVVGHLGERRLGRGMRRRPLVDAAARRSAVSVTAALSRSASAWSGVVPRRDLLRDEAGHERHHHHAAVLRQPRRGSRRARCADGRPARAPTECEKITGASATSSASLIAPGETCERSTSMPSRFISRTTSSPKRVSPPCRALVERGVGPVERDVVRERHVAHAQVVVGAQRAERVLDRVAALDARAARRCRPRLKRARCRRP